MTRAVAFLIVSTLLLSTAPDADAGTGRTKTAGTAKRAARATSRVSRRPRAPTFRNPVIDADFADPSVVRGHDGALYAYATQDGTDNVQVRRSRDDGVTWTRLPDALPRRAAWSDGSPKRETWAPDVSYDGRRYTLYFSGQVNESYAATHNRRRPAGEHIAAGSMAIGVATSLRPEGPFLPRRAPLRVGRGFQNIDAMAFVDTRVDARGAKKTRTILYWGSDDLGIMAQELDATGLRFARGSKPVQVLATSPGRPYQRLLEAAFVIAHEGRYYLMVSGDDCCGGGDATKAHYAVLAAVADDPFGPFEIQPGATPEAEDTILRATPTGAKGRRALAPGHNGVFEAGGRRWMAFHFIDEAHPTDTGSGYPRRPMGIAPLDIVDGRLRVGDGTPPMSRQRAPGHTRRDP